MVKNIENKKVTILFSDEKINLSDDLQDKIDAYWKKVVLDNPNLWDGEIICVSEIIETENEIKFICKSSHYSHYIYDERVGITGKEQCRNLSAGAVIETSDEFYVVGQMAENTSVPKMLQEPGGNADKTDGQDSEIDSWKVIQREVLEEINIDIFDEKQVESKKLKYCTRVKENALGYQIFAKVDLKMTAKELKQHFENYLKHLKENKKEIEFDELVFLNKTQALAELEKLPNPKREYLKPLLQAESKTIERDKER